MVKKAVLEHFGVDPSVIASMRVLGCFILLKSNKLLGMAVYLNKARKNLIPPRKLAYIIEGVWGR